MKSEIKELINEYLESLAEEVPQYVDGSFDGYRKLEHIPTFTGFITWLTGKEFTNSENGQNYAKRNNN